MKTSGDIEADITQLQKKARGFLKKENYEQAIEVRAEIVRIRKEQKTRGEKDIQLGEALLELGSAHYLDALKNKKFRWDPILSHDAVECYQQALDIFENSVGLYDPRTFKSHELLAISTNDEEKDRHLRMAIAGRENYLSNEFFKLSPEERMKFQKGHRPFDLVKYFDSDGNIANTVLRHKGIVLDSILEDNKLRDLADIIKRNSQGKLDPQLVRSGRRAFSAHHIEVSQQLPSGSCLVEFFKYKTTKDYLREANSADLSYGAVVLTKNKQPKYLSLAMADEVDQAVDRFATWISKESHYPREALPLLHRSLINPILEWLPEGTDTLIICPDSKLSFIPFAALYEKNSFFDITNLSSASITGLKILIILGFLIFIIRRFKKEAWRKKLSPWLMAFYIVELLILIIAIFSYLEESFSYPLLCFALGLGVRYAMRCNTPKLVGFSYFKQQSNNFMFSSLLYGINSIYTIFPINDPQSLKQLFIVLCCSLCISNVMICTTCMPSWILMRMVTKKVKVYSKYYHMLLFGIFLSGFIISVYVFDRIWLSDHTYLYSLVLVICFLFFGTICFREKLSQGSQFSWPYKNILTLVLFLACPFAAMCLIDYDSKLFEWEKSADGPFLCENYNISYVSTGRDLLKESISMSKNKNALIIADPDYSTEQERTPSEIDIFALLRTEKNSLQEIVRNLNFDPLPGTRKEAEKLQKILEEEKYSVQKLVGPEATEKNLFHQITKPPHILHFATHGFFVNNREKLDGKKGQIRFFEFENENNQTIVDPMRRSGLALAGAKTTFENLEKGVSTNQDNDGILLGTEAASLSLSENWLTTLSACETGAGTSQDGEGVLGLRRAFIQAGAQNLLLTLWEVGDNRTADFMSAFYKKALETKNPPAALSETQREFLVKERIHQKSPSRAIRYYAPFTLTFMGKPK